ncbi:YjcQ family protein [Pelosinus sp. UFO1]|uniref:YjcQ family protein n=1 Tax=Pelosinus sp. UFO1 TaxID=484770 RepID=UPI0004D119C2|nr:YjcQ family protein [Pelosinus sp. UFO1]AIF51237.1 hypothetical protein UFO1_1686 [Pelosinus sp. UFO1]
MELDTKQKVLIAIYTEYQKDIPDMASITSSNLGIDHDIFKIALDKLDNEGLVNGLNILKGGYRSIPKQVIIHHAKMSSYGINYVETKLNIQPSLSNKEKVKVVIDRSTEWGWEQLKDIGSKVLSEVIKSHAGI